MNKDAGNTMFLNQSPAEGGQQWEMSNDAQQRRFFYDREYGQKKGVDKQVAMIKPYKVDDDFPRIYDAYRVFAVAIASARPFEMVDIRISRQAI